MLTTVAFQMSSIGSLHESFIKEFLDSARGNMNTKGKGKKATAKRKHAQSKQDNQQRDDTNEEDSKRGRKRRRTDAPASEQERIQAGPDIASTPQERRPPPFRIIYPSADWVRGAKYSMGAGMLMLQEKNWSSPDFPRSAFHGITPNVFFPGNPEARDELVLHSKVLTRTVATPDGGRYGWIYTGSHNFSGVRHAFIVPSMY